MTTLGYEDSNLGSNQSRGTMEPLFRKSLFNLGHGIQAGDSLETRNKIAPLAIGVP